MAASGAQNAAGSCPEATDISNEDNPLDVMTGRTVGTLKALQGGGRRGMQPQVLAQQHQPVRVCANSGVRFWDLEAIWIPACYLTT